MKHKSFHTKLVLPQFRPRLLQLVLRDFPESAQFVPFQLEEVPFFSFAFILFLDSVAENLELLSGHGGGVDAIDDVADTPFTFTLFLGGLKHVG